MRRRRVRIKDVSKLKELGWKWVDSEWNPHWYKHSLKVDPKGWLKIFSIKTDALETFAELVKADLVEFVYWASEPNLSVKMSKKELEDYTEYLDKKRKGELR